MTSHRYGEITGRYVIYRGDSAEVEGIQYLNVEEYLKFLKQESRFRIDKDTPLR